MEDFPSIPVVKNPPCNAGDAGSIPGQEAKILYAVEQLSLHGTTKEPMCCNYWYLHPVMHALWTPCVTDTKSPPYN